MDAAASCARWDRRAGRKIRERSRACSDERCFRGRRSRVVLTPRRRRQVSGVLVGPTGLGQNISADDGDKNARSPGRARNKPLKPLRAGMPGDSGVPVASTPVLSTLHRGLRVQRAPGIPHALQGAEDKCKPRAHRAAGSRSRVWTSLRAKRSNPPSLSLRGKMDCFAEPVIGRAFARPVGSQ